MSVFSADEVSDWDGDSVAGWLNLIKCKDCVEPFLENEIDGTLLLEIDAETLKEYGIADDTAARFLEALKELKATPPTPDLDEDFEDSDADDEGYTNPQDAVTSDMAQVTISQPITSAATKGAKTSSKISKNKKKDPLRLAAKGKSVADLESSTVTSGYLWKVGGSGLKMKHWKRRYFVLTDDNCLYYFKSQKEMSALGLIMLPSYTITVVPNSENVGSREHAWKAFNRMRDGDRQYVFAADNAAEMKQWMNVMSLASIAFGSGKASMQKTVTSGRLADDSELDSLMQKAPARVGGVSGSDDRIANVGSNVQDVGVVPSHIQKAGKQKGRTLCLIKMLDGETLQLYAENNTIGQDFLMQVCTLLSAHERYYFGLSFIDRKGDQQWLEMDKKVSKHDFPKKGADHIDLQFEIRFYPMDVTQVMQYVTLYQAFLSARRDVVTEKLTCTGKDAMLLAALSMQALRGDYNPTVHSKTSINPADVIPGRTMREARIPANIPGDKLIDFWRDELVRCWVKMAGILKHLAVLKYMQIVQKHRMYGMAFVEVKNKKGTPLTLGVSPQGLFVYRLERVNNQEPVVKFSWSECSELAFTEKKFTIQVHDKNTKAFSVYCARAKVCQRVLRLCVGLHQLYVQTVRNWTKPPPELAAMRQLAIKAALKEREELQKIAQQAMLNANKAVQPKSPVKADTPVLSTPVLSPELAEPEVDKNVKVAGRDKAVKLMDMMMDDEDFMKMQDELLMGMEDAIGDGYDMVGDDGALDPSDDQMRDRCASEAIGDRVQYMERLEHN